MGKDANIDTLSDTNVKTTCENPFVFTTGYKPTTLSINDSFSGNTLNVHGIDLEAWWDDPNAPAHELTKSNISLTIKDRHGVEKAICVDSSTFIEVVKSGLISLNIMSVQD